ncbi:hypothetical protein GRI38_07905 [Altererythrobacter aurantiacus]|uniref:Uncharacterized protein n=1 Tax=Parapontixanthobacter aurantiacus TaxID=1463599 RepID=A0A844ZFN1_9SPHN|nr:hypothetical protein [Parapontixanthobacter aurantiacus]MXO85956.1 hypothetical protein [Parapontixanthobacter aurantiacus]
MAKANHITDRGGRKIRDAANSVDDDNDVPGPSTNPATNLFISDILLRSVGRLARTTMEKGLVGKRYGSQFAKDAVENRSLLHTLTAYGLTKVATRSVPGAAAVGGGLLLKTLFDRSRSRRKSRSDGAKTLRKQADPDSAI